MNNPQTSADPPTKSQPDASQTTIVTSTNTSMSVNSSSNPFAPAPAAQPTAPPWRYGLFSLMLAMLVFSVIGVAANQLLRAVRQGTSPKVAFVMFTLTAPVMLVTLISLARGIAVWVRGR